MEEQRIVTYHLGGWQTLPERHFFAARRQFLRLPVRCNRAGRVKLPRAAASSCPPVSHAN